MITKFSVKNFRCFSNWTSFELTSDKKYEFNENAVHKNAIQHSKVYGENGEGKTNLGIAMLELISHLSPNKVKYPTFEKSYLNADCDSDIAEFKFIFSLNNKEIKYHYGKDASADIVYESLYISDKEVLSWDKRSSNIANIDLEGTKSLNTELSENVSSLVSYVLNNASLPNNHINQTFFKFYDFVNRMVFFKTMSNVNQFAGAFPSTHSNLSEQIIKDYGIKKLESFLNESGINCKLTTYASVDGSRIALVSKKNLDFFSIASSGTFALIILFVWLQKIQNGEVSFAYIDEFDAFFHHKLAKNIAKNLAQSPVQTILSTHNTSIMSNNILRPDCYFKIKNKKITPLYKLSDRELRKAHNLEKMYRSGSFDE